jgi:hypothetical protein
MAELDWSKIKKKIQKRFSDYDTHSGCYAYFAVVDRHMGAKVFYNRSAAVFSHALQKGLSEHRKTEAHAPKVYSDVFEIKLLDSVYWAYLTERINMSRNKQGAVQKQLFSVKDVLRKTGYSFSPSKTKVRRVFADDHDGNWGNRNGKLVWVDFF